MTFILSTFKNMVACIIYIYAMYNPYRYGDLILKCLRNGTTLFGKMTVLAWIDWENIPSS